MGNIIHFLISSLLVVAITTAKPFHEQQQISKNIKIAERQMFECVDFHKQPAFVHPRIKNAKHEVKVSKQTNNEDLSGRMGFKHFGCPFGTIPIPIKDVAKQRAIQPQSQDPPKDHCWAIVRTRLRDQPKQFYGGVGAVSSYKLKVENRQWSTSRLKVINGQESIEVGLMVNPSLYHDDQARIYAKFSNGSVECLNYDCGIFVKNKSNGMYLGQPISHYSEVGAHTDKWYYNVSIAKRDQKWWVSLYADNGNRRDDIGYYPGTLFTTLVDNAAQIEWGGEIGNPDKDWPTTQMGSGNLPRRYDPDYCAFFTDIMVMDQNAHYYEDEDTEKEFNCREYYRVLDFGSKRSPEFPGRTIVFGGPVRYD